MGDTNDFAVVDGWLHSASTKVNDTFMILKPSLTFEEWKLDISLDLNTSSANYVWWILHSDSADIFKGTCYYVLIGGTKDEFSLCRMTYGTQEVLINGRDKTSENAKLGLRVTRVESNWTLERIYPDSIVNEGSAEITEFNETAAYTGILVRQSTASFHGKHYFDNFYCGQRIIDTLPPRLDSLHVYRNAISLFFNEWLNASAPMSFRLGDFDPDSVEITGHQLNLQFDNIVNGSYLFEISSVSDSIGNVFDSSFLVAIHFGRYPSKGDLIFNEILFDPHPGSYDFIELYNRSGELLELDGVQLYRNVNGEVKDLIVMGPMLLEADTYLAFTEDSLDIRTQYKSGPNIHELKIPPMNNSDGIIVIRDRQGALIDSLPYTDDMHFEFLNSTEGVSLERIHLEGSSYETSLWTSASSTAGFATPSLPNSQLDSFSFNKVDLAYDIISPDNDGFHDLLIVQFLFSEPGFILQARIFDLDGRLLDRPGNQLTLSTKGIFTWDLMKTDASILLPGTYVLYFEAINPNGTILRKKFAFTVI